MRAGAGHGVLALVLLLQGKLASGILFWQLAEPTLRVLKNTFRIPELIRTKSLPIADEDVYLLHAENSERTISWVVSPFFITRL